jgi:hypothetical protein
VHAHKRSFGEEEKSEQAKRKLLVMIDAVDVVGKTLHRRGRRVQQRCHRLNQ